MIFTRLHYNCIIKKNTWVFVWEPLRFCTVMSREFFFLRPDNEKEIQNKINLELIDNVSIQLVF